MSPHVCLLFCWLAHHIFKILHPCTYWSIGWDNLMSLDTINAIIIRCESISHPISNALLRLCSMILGPSRHTCNSGLHRHVLWTCHIAKYLVGAWRGRWAACRGRTRSAGSGGCTQGAHPAAPHRRISNVCKLEISVPRNGRRCYNGRRRITLNLWGFLYNSFHNCKWKKKRFRA